MKVLHNVKKEDYTTNDNESENFGVDGIREIIMADFIDKLRIKAESQIREEEKSLYGSGKYKLDKRSSLKLASGIP